MIGYKIAKNNSIRVVVTLEIPADAQTNMGRSSVAVRETAKYRASKAKVLAIEDASGTPYTTATSFSFDKKSLTYIVGEVIEEPTYNPDPEQVCAEGIHYFLTRRVAELYGLGKVENGLFQKWHSNGQKNVEATYVDGKHHGPYQRWYENGQKDVEVTYIDGEFHGLYQGWHENGQKYEKITYVDGKRHGPYQSWHKNGQKWEEATYIDGKVTGLYQSWYSNGQKWDEATWVDGKFHGLYQRWHSNGQKWN